MTFKYFIVKMTTSYINRKTSYSYLIFIKLSFRYNRNFFFLYLLSRIVVLFCNQTGDWRSILDFWCRIEQECLIRFLNILSLLFFHFLWVSFLGFLATLVV